MRTNDRIFSVRRNDWNNFPWGEAIVKSVTDPDNVNHQTTYEYYDNNSSSLKYGLLKKQVSSSGKWTKYDYDSSKRRKSVVRPFMSSDSTEGDNAHRKTTYDYGQDALMAYTPEVTTDYLLGVVIGKTYHVVTTNNFMRTEIHERAATQNADFGDAGNLRTTTVYYSTNSASISAGKIHYIDSPGGLRTTWSYVEDAAGYHVVETQGTTASPDGIANKTTCVTNTWDASGNNIRSETFVYTESGSESIGWTSRLFDELRGVQGHPL